MDCDIGKEEAERMSCSGLMKTRINFILSFYKQQKHLVIANMLYKQKLLLIENILTFRAT